MHRKYRRTYVASVTGTVASDPGAIQNWTLVSWGGTVRATLRLGSATGQVLETLQAVVGQAAVVGADLDVPYEVLFVTFTGGASDTLLATFRCEKRGSPQLVAG